MRVLHTGDLHFSNKPEKLEEVIRCTDSILEQAQSIWPDLIVLAGDTVDEHDGPIRIDSDCARAAIRFVLACADIAPVAIVRGTPSHDRRTPEIFRELRGANPIYVASQIEMVALVDICNGYDPSPAYPDGPYFFPYGSDYHGGTLQAVLTFIPSPDKSRIIGAFGGESKQLTSLMAKEALHDALAYIGEINNTVTCPRILIAHGMIAGSEYSTGATSTGEDLEFSVHDLKLANADVYLFGHVHKHQIFAGNIVYAGSPGRLNFGETEEKGFLVAEVLHGAGILPQFIKTPAREFHFVEVGWESLAKLEEEFAKCMAECAGKDTRFRYTIPEEEKAAFPRERVVAGLEQAGARNVKVEYSIIPKERVRAAGISRLDTLEAKLVRWGETTETVIPERSREIIRGIEGCSKEELLEFARKRLPQQGGNSEYGPSPLVDALPIFKEVVANAING